ncbi:carboxymuconolactone decarboxylase family protein [Bifidobacterium simiarum]|uniref:Carboxymuconolactone decarboxylase n=1 Tax=Bifidobacterium simiarum TaxID=2045441 RepID=A0A2M9HEH0_9BIFI|nr:carboxymuconolactone decarboxylase family protein [Bifidobacterium simiarum]MBT1165709.1 carboxymuconolactone decarboxylase family protein [Bifidobacterium simiarum]PJM75213.1 carboxymuconolactone decarboxylase [Bifidobacterium simiarum]
MAFDSLKKSARKFWRDDIALGDSDPQFVELFNRFAYDEVLGEPNANHPDLTDARRSMAILAALIGCGGLDEYGIMLSVALKGGVTPVQVKEIVYQAVPYLGFGRVLPFLTATNDLFQDRDIALPVEQQGTVDESTRRTEGERIRRQVLGAADRPPRDEATGHIRTWETDNCYGDYYTRGGLDLADREMVTVCLLAALGGCEPQLVSHAAARIRSGVDRRFLIAVISQCLPYIGYPRATNALRCVDIASDAVDAEREAMQGLAEQDSAEQNSAE